MNTTAQAILDNIPAAARVDFLSETKPEYDGPEGTVWKMEDNSILTLDRNVARWYAS